MLRSIALLVCFTALAGFAAGQAEPEPLPPEVAALVKQFKSFDARRRVEALERLAKLGENGRAATPALLDLLTSPKLNSKIQTAALATLEKTNPTAYKPLLSLLLDEATDTRSEALTQIGEMPKAEREAFYPVVVRTYLVERSRSNAGSSLLPQYLDLMANHYADKPEVADVFIQAIAFNPNARGSESRSRAIALSSNLKLDRKLYFKALVSALGDDTPETRTEVIKAIGAYKGEAKSLLPVLKRLKFDKTQSVREAAAVAVFLIENDKP